jgi:hypothetical protein
MSPRATRIVKGALLKKGFVEEEDGSHRKLRLWVNGSGSHIHTYYSHGARECDDYILGQMAIHLFLSRARLNDLIDCKMSGDDYIGLLRDRGEL